MDRVAGDSAVTESPVVSVRLIEPPLSEPKVTEPKLAEAKVVTLDLTDVSVTDVNRFLHRDVPARRVARVRIDNPGGTHNLAVGVDADVEVEILGHAGYYAGGMNKRATLTIHGNAERGVAENMMSGAVRVKGNASEMAGASAHGGLLVIEGDAAGRCGISMKGADIVVGGSVGHLSAFMAQAGRLVVCGDAGPGLGDSLYEAVIYVRGKIEGLGADARQEEMTPADIDGLTLLLDQAGVVARPRDFKKVTSARSLYHWNAANCQEY